MKMLIVLNVNFDDASAFWTRYFCMIVKEQLFLSHICEKQTSIKISFHNWHEYHKWSNYVIPKEEKLNSAVCWLCTQYALHMNTFTCQWINGIQIKLAM